MKGRIPAAIAAVVALTAAATAWAAQLTPEGSPYPVGTGPYGIYAADFNGDGRPDFATVNGDSDPGDVSVYLRSGNGFAQENGSPYPGRTTTGTVADFNGDGRPDIAIADFTFGQGVRVLLRTATGFAEETQPDLSGALSAAGAGDLNGDGKVDLVVANWTGAFVRVLFRRSANDGFDLGETFSTGTNPRAIAVADLDGDGDLDLAVTNQGSDNVSILANDGSGTFTPEGTITTGDMPNGIAVADLDGDGRLDFAVSNSNAGTVLVALRYPSNNGYETGMVPVGTGPGLLAIGDLDGDGAPEIAVPLASGSLVVVERSGSGFAAEAPIPLTGTPNAVALADFNGDGASDAAVVARGPDQVHVLLGTPPSTPTPTPVATPVPTATPAPTTTPLPAPARGEVNVLPAEGKVRIKVRGSTRYVPLTEAIQVKAGASIDARDGTVTLVGPGRSDKADFSDGLFKLSQSRGLTTLTLTEALDCSRRARASAARKPKTRKLWGDGKGKFRTKGRYAAATVRGTRWLTQDTCTTTRVSVRQGSVSFRNEVTKRTTVVRRGRSATARARR